MSSLNPTYGPQTLTQAYESNPEEITAVVDKMAKPSIGEAISASMSKAGKVALKVLKGLGYIMATVFTAGLIMLNGNFKRAASDFFLGTSKANDYAAVHSRAAAQEAAKNEDGNLPVIRAEDLQAKIAQRAEAKRRKDEPTVGEQAVDTLYDGASATTNYVNENPVQSAAIGLGLGAVVFTAVALFGNK